MAEGKGCEVIFYEKVLPALPVAERCNLDRQIRRAAISITANIAEGHGRFHFQEGIQFYRMAQGSVYEVEDHLHSFLDLQDIPQPVFEEGLDLIETAKKLLNGYINFVHRQK